LVRVDCPSLIPRIGSHRIRTKPRAHTACAQSCAILVTSHQPGGTFLAVTGCYAAHVSTTDADSTGLGCWSYSKVVGRNGRRFLIISAYHVGDQQLTIGLHTAYTQQYHLLLQQGHLNPNPREIFVTDMILFLQCWQNTHDIFLCLDTNNTMIHSKDHGLDHILEATTLIDLHKYKLPSLSSPATHQHGSKTIDYCLGSHGFTEALTGAWMLPFGTPATLTGDHRTMGLEFDHDVLFRQKVPHSDHTK